jgi:hypothetical protein
MIITLSMQLSGSDYIQAILLPMNRFYFEGKGVEL